MVPRIWGLRGLYRGSIGIMEEEWKVLFRVWGSMVPRAWAEFGVQGLGWLQWCLVFLGFMGSTQGIQGLSWDIRNR